jgi:predicted AAA+ superfamily ATPase
MDATQPLVISGPRGAGKSTLVGHVIDHRPNVVRINVKTLLEKKEELMVRRSTDICLTRTTPHAVPWYAVTYRR